jgi:hypothetical protein
VEGPTYLGAIMAFRSYQANVECLTIDHDGLDTKALERRLAAGLVPKLLYTQGPGVLMIRPIHSARPRSGEHCFCAGQTP